MGRRFDEGQGKPLPGSGIDQDPSLGQIVKEARSAGLIDEIGKCHIRQRQQLVAAFRLSSPCRFLRRSHEAHTRKSLRQIEDDLGPLARHDPPDEHHERRRRFFGLDRRVEWHRSVLRVRAQPVEATDLCLEKPRRHLNGVSAPGGESGRPRPEIDEGRNEPQRAVSRKPEVDPPIAPVARVHAFDDMRAIGHRPLPKLGAQRCLDVVIHSASAARTSRASARRFQSVIGSYRDALQHRGRIGKLVIGCGGRSTLHLDAAGDKVPAKGAGADAVALRSPRRRETRW